MNPTKTIKTTRDILNIDGFDPMGLDITYIKDTMAEIPEDGVIDINNAERLATIFLRCADYCGDLVAKATHYWGYKETQQRAQKSGAIYRKIKEHITQTVAKEAYADDQEYIKAANEATTAEALVKWLDEKYQDLIKGHILCKNILARNIVGERANSWQGSESEEDYKTPAASSSPFGKPLMPALPPDGGIMRPGFIDL